MAVAGLADLPITMAVACLADLPITMAVACLADLPITMVVACLADLPTTMAVACLADLPTTMATACLADLPITMAVAPLTPPTHPTHLSSTAPGRAARIMRMTCSTSDKPPGPSCCSRPWFGGPTKSCNCSRQVGGPRGGEGRKKGGPGWVEEIQVARG